MSTAQTKLVEVIDIKFENHWSGFGIGTETPRISWRFKTSDQTLVKNWIQSSCDIQVSPHKSSECRTFSIQGAKSTYVPWPDTPLQSRERTFVRVRVRGNFDCDGESLTEVNTSWSDWHAVECGLLDPAVDWVARPIKSSERWVTPSGSLRPVRFMTKDSSTIGRGKISKARLYVTAQGCYIPFVNGIRVSDHELAPGWTSYSYRMNYQVFDVTRQLKEDSANMFSVEVAEGWFAGRLGFDGGRRYLYGDSLSLMAQLEVVFEDLSHITICTDTSWSCRRSATIQSELYDGETYDASLEERDSLESSAPPLTTVSLSEKPYSTLVVPEAPPVKVISTIEPIEIIKTPSGKLVLDFGQNLVGKVLIKRLRASQGRRISIQHFEVLEQGEPGIRPLRCAKNLDTLILGEQDIENWTPRFACHGFRYIHVDGWDSTEDPDASPLNNIVALVMHNDMKRTGWFECSNTMINKLHENALWSMKGNFVSIPTDCPQRDERLGWTGDIQAFGPSANFLYDTTSFLGDWLRDLSAEQDPLTGIPPFVVPNVIEHLWDSYPQAVWDDATVLVPWALFRASGDKAILQKQIASMKLWVDNGIRRGSDGLWDPEVWHLGDWLDPMAPPDEPGNGRTNGTLVADSYLVHVTSILSQVCQAVGQTAWAKEYSDAHKRLRLRFQEKYVSPAGLVVGDSQTALTLAIAFELLSDQQQISTAGDRLKHLVRLAKFKVATGFAGTPLILHALSSCGHTDVAYRMLLEQGCPSWLYPITLGATTCWERWDSMLPDGSINPGEMTSFNHYALGSVINWLHEVVAGVKPLEPGWSLIQIKPRPGGGLSHSSITYQSPYGRLESHWKITDVENVQLFELEVVVPPNSNAIITMPHGNTSDIGIQVGSGSYHFECEYFENKEVLQPIVPFMKRAEGFA